MPNGRCGVYWEVGAGWVQGAHLLDMGWRHAEHKAFPSAMLEPLADFNYFKGYFVEPSARQIVGLEDAVGWHERAVIVQAAVAGSNGLRPAEIINKGMANVDRGPNWVEYNKENYADVQSVWMATVSLDELALKLEPPHLLRVDIEDMEVEALGAYSFDPAPRVVAVDHHHHNEAAVREILEGHGYRVFAHPGTDEDLIGVLE